MHNTMVLNIIVKRRWFSFKEFELSAVRKKQQVCKHYIFFKVDCNEVVHGKVLLIVLSADGHDGGHDGGHGGVPCCGGGDGRPLLWPLRS